MKRRAVVLGLLAAALGPAGSPASAGAGRGPGLSPATAFVTVYGLGRSVRLDERGTLAALDAVWQALGEVPAVAPVGDGPRLLAAVRLNEQVLDVAIWKPQTLVVAGGRFPNVSALLVPVTGTWRHRILVVQIGHVVASPALVDSPALAAIDDAVRTAVGPR